MTDVYERLRQKLDGMTKGYPKTEKGSEMAFLKKVFSEADAEFFIKFKPGLQSPQQVAEHMGISLKEARDRLEVDVKERPAVLGTGRPGEKISHHTLHPRPVGIPGGQI